MIMPLTFLSKKITPYEDKGNKYRSLFVYPFVLNQENVMFFLFSNKLEKGKELLNWLLSEIHQSDGKKK